MSVDTVDYGDGRKLQAGIVTTDQVPLAADTYFNGMELEFDTTAYKALVTDANVAAIYNGGDANGVGRVLAAPGVGDCIMAGEIDETGLVTDANVTKVLTEAQRATRRNRGFYIKRA